MAFLLILNSNIIEGNDNYKNYCYFLFLKVVDVVDSHKHLVGIPKASACNKDYDSSDNILIYFRNFVKVVHAAVAEGMSLN